MNENQRYRACNNFTVSEVAGEKVILPISNSVDTLNNLFVLNDTGAFIIDLLMQGKSVAEIVLQLTSTYDVDSSTALADVSEYVQDVVSRGFFVEI
mgnify:CR=1 FL=1